MAVLGIVMVNILLSGDNALVIALASRNLSPEQRKKAMLWGSAGAVVLRIILTFGAVLLLKIPYVQIVGGLLLFWIAAKLIGNDEHKQDQVAAEDNLFKAIRTIIVADVVMSLDNVLAIAGVAKGNLTLLIFGLAISIPLIVWGSKAIGVLIEKWPVIILFGAAFLGWTSGEMVAGDEVLRSSMMKYGWLEWGIPALFGLLVVIIGKMMATGKKGMRNW